MSLTNGTGIENLEEWEVELDDWLREVTEEDLVQIVEKLGFEIWKRATNRTPVDTGRARGGWTISWGAQPTWQPEAGKHFSPDNQKEDVTLADAPDPGEPKMFGTLHVTNNVEYIVILEHGHSDQAPQGMLEQAVNEVIEQF